MRVDKTICERCKQRARSPARDFWFSSSGVSWDKGHEVLCPAPTKDGSDRRVDFQSDVPDNCLCFFEYAVLEGAGRA